MHEIENLYTKIISIKLQNVKIYQKREARWVGYFIYFVPWPISRLSSKIVMSLDPPRAKARLVKDYVPFLWMSIKVDVSAGLVHYSGHRLRNGLLIYYHLITKPLCLVFRS